jgi:hypothetical protein
MVEQYIPNILIQVQVLSKNSILIRELSLMVKHMTFNHYYMSSNPIALIKNQNDIINKQTNKQTNKQNSKVMMELADMNSLGLFD